MHIPLKNCHFRTREDDDVNPTSPYGLSKLTGENYARLFFKLYGLKTVSLRYFNIYGPRQRFDPRFAYGGVISIFVNRIMKNVPPIIYGDGEQTRDFIYVKDAVDMTLFFLDSPRLSGLFNIGTGMPRSWNDLAKATFAAMSKEPDIEYIEMPETIRNQYQYYTCADITKLRKAGYTRRTATLEEAITDYVQNYLQKEAYLSEISTDIK